MDPDIDFVFQGVCYTVSRKALDLKKIVLPDGRVLEIYGSFEFDDRPPQIFHLNELPNLKTADVSPEEIAQQVKGFLAQPVSAK
jgi:hypothetical protein